MYNVEDQIDNKTKAFMPGNLYQQNSVKSIDVEFQQGLVHLNKNKTEEALRCFWKAIDFGYSRALLPAIVLEIGSDVPYEMSRPIKDVLKRLENICDSGNETAMLILAHWNMNWDLSGNGIQCLNLDTLKYNNWDRQLSPVEVEDVPELQAMSLSRLDRILSSFRFRISTMGYMSDQVNTEYAIRLLKHLMEKRESKAAAAEKYLYYLLTDNYDLWIEDLLPWLQEESKRDNEYAIRLLSRIRCRNQYTNKSKLKMPWFRCLT